MYVYVFKLSKQYPTSEYEVKTVCHNDIVIQKGKYFTDNLNFV